MSSSTTMILGRVVTGPHPTVSGDRPYPKLVTESWSQRQLAVPTAMGSTRRGRPPPDAAARVLQTFVLLGALWLALMVQCAFS